MGHYLLYCRRKDVSSLMKSIYSLLYALFVSVPLPPVGTCMGVSSSDSVSDSKDEGL